MTKIQGLDRLFSPSSLAMIGASKYDQKGGGFLLRRLISSGFTGKLYPVNPKESEIMGLRSYPNILDIPGEVDLAVVAVSAKTVPQVIAECCQKGVKFAVIHSVGFSELGAQGRELENEVLRLSRQSTTRLVGPNCMGLYCPQAGLNTIVPGTGLKNEAGQVAFLGQSGWVCGNFIMMGYERGLRFSKVVSIGNQSDLTIEDFLEYFAADAETKVIACYIEGIKRGREFLQLAKHISTRKPVLVWKAGRTEAGVRAVASHTGALAGSGAVFDAALRQSGIVSAQNLEELIDLAVGFTCPVMPGGNRLGVLAESGSSAVASADIYEGLGLEMPTLSRETQKELADTLQDIIPAFPSLQNPVDIVWIPLEHSARVFLQCSRLILRDVDAILLVDYTPLDKYYSAKLAALRDELRKPIIIIPGHAIEQKQGMSLLVRNGIPTFTIPERALKVLSAMVRYSNYLRQG